MAAHGRPATDSGSRLASSSAMTDQDVLAHQGLRPLTVPLHDGVVDALVLLDRRAHPAGDGHGQAADPGHVVADVVQHRGDPAVLRLGVEDHVELVQQRREPVGVAGPEGRRAVPHDARQRGQRPRWRYLARPPARTIPPAAPAPRRSRADPGGCIRRRPRCGTARCPRSRPSPAGRTPRGAGSCSPRTGRPAQPRGAGNRAAAWRTRSPAGASGTPNPSAGDARRRPRARWS